MFNETFARSFVVVRLQARRLGVSVATVFHAAWGLVLAHTCAREDVVFGSVLLGRLQSSMGPKGMRRNSGVNACKVRLSES